MFRRHCGASDADGVESFDELAAHQVGPLPVGGEADDADRGAWLRVARDTIADRAPGQLMGSWCGWEVDPCCGEVGADRDDDDRLLGLEVEQVRDGRAAISLSGEWVERLMLPGCAALAGPEPSTLGPRWGRRTTKSDP